MIVAIGIASFVLSFTAGQWGPCGPNEFGLGLFVIALVAIPTGGIWLIVSAVRKTLRPRHNA
jgi:hypothetical protein